jgi:hypothetical protein
MINIPFIGHIFVFSILAASVDAGGLLMAWALPVAGAGIIFTFWSLRILRTAGNIGDREIRGLMLFSIGWQLTAVFGGFIILTASGMPLGEAVMANSSAISHFGLFAAIQGGMFGDQASGMIAFVFAMPFLVHPFVFWIFGKTMENNDRMPVKIVYTLTAIGLSGILWALIF